MSTEKHQYLIGKEESDIEKEWSLIVVIKILIY